METLGCLQWDEGGTKVKGRDKCSRVHTVVGQGAPSSKRKTETLFVTNSNLKGVTFS